MFFPLHAAEFQFMTRTQHQSISIAPNQNKPALSKGQKAFNSLIKQI
ncbi:hypothetical protein [Ralstonia solanacearum]|nr:hypothetical protein [Ralstonia solanacearum]MCL9847299.1 hypothetical protein [Ralstonia solanacearum]MDC6261163.1 hypothetical protein [Ralstonia solanacearum]